MTKAIKWSYLLNLVGVAAVFAILSALFAFNGFGDSTTYVEGVCTTACYTIIMVASLNLVVGFMGEFSLGHAGFVSVGAYVSAITSSALAGKGLSDLALLLVAVLAGGIVMVNNYQKMRDMESVLASVMPAGAEYLPGGEEEKPELVLETGVTVQPETMTAGMPEPPETGAAASEPAETGAAVSEPAASGTAEAVSGAAASKPAETGAAASEPAASGAAEAVSGEAEAVHIPSLEEADQQMEVLGQALEEASTHVVQDGETLYGICLEKYHDLSRVDEVCRLNGLEDVNKIKAGQKLILP